MNMLRLRLRDALRLLSLFWLSALAAAQKPDTPRAAAGHYNLEKGLALGGYDPVAYHGEGGGKPTKGKREISLKYRGVTYRFASKTHLEIFKKAPARFEPAYGGWCAYAMARGKKVEIDPRSFLIENDRLLVFYKGLFNDTRKTWKKEGSAKLTTRANASWKKISGEGAERDTTQFNLEKGLALGGYDPVAYSDGAARKGKQTLSASFKGIDYRFSTEASKAAFLARPDSFEPRYGGWCAWAMAEGKKAPVSPEIYVSGEQGTFLFYSSEKRDAWMAARSRMVKDADAHWAKLAGSR